MTHPALLAVAYALGDIGERERVVFPSQLLSLGAFVQHYSSDVSAWFLRSAKTIYEFFYVSGGRSIDRSIFCFLFFFFGFSAQRERVRKVVDVLVLRSSNGLGAIFL